MQPVNERKVDPGVRAENISQDADVSPVQAIPKTVLLAAVASLAAWGLEFGAVAFVRSTCILCFARVCTTAMAKQHFM